MFNNFSNHFGLGGRARKNLWHVLQYAVAQTKIVYKVIHKTCEYRIPMNETLNKRRKCNDDPMLP